MEHAQNRWEQMISERHKPRQERSRATVERILQTSAALLEEVGLEGFNTNLIATRASVGMHAIYRYFPNKTAILLALLEQRREAERAWIGDLGHIDEVDDWRAAVRAIISSYYEAAAVQPGYAALRIAARASFEMQAADRAIDAELEKELAGGLRGLGVDVEPMRLAIVCRTIIESASRLFDVALAASPEEALLVIDELTAMITRYLDGYIPAHVT